MNGYVFLLCCTTSLLIPLISKTHNEQVTLYSKALYPLYFQTNVDAPIELESSLGFPFVFREIPVRVNRPIVNGSVAFLRTLVVLLIEPFVSPELKSIYWGKYPALQWLVSYALWIMLHGVFTLLAIWLLVKTIVRIGFPLSAFATAMLVCTTPIIILSLREIQLGSFELLSMCAALAFWVEVLIATVSRKKLLCMSLGIGVLLCGKLAISTFAAGCLIILFTNKRKVLLTIIPCLLVPLLVWIAVLRVLSIPFMVYELHDYYGESLARFNRVESMVLFTKIPAFLLLWIRGLWESTGWVHVPFFVVGVITLVKAHKKKLLLIGLVFLISDVIFYYILNRVHAIYAMHSMLFVLMVVGAGIVACVEWLQKRSALKISDTMRDYGIAIFIIALQVSILMRVLPGYGG